MKPIILVPTASQVRQDKPERLYVNRVDASSIEQAGGIVFGIARPSDDKTLDEIIALADGFYMAGGVDMDTKWYGATPNPLANNDPFDAERDTLELALMKRAHEKRIPILGICRGMQNLNVYFGGTLHQDLALEAGTKLHDSRHNADRGAIVHKVFLAEDTHYGRIVGEQSFGVNSMHHQGINVLGKGLTVAAKADDGLIEVIELQNYPFCIGTQWHPEELHDAPSAKLFTAFIEACKTYQETKNKSQ